VNAWGELWRNFPSTPIPRIQLLEKPMPGHPDMTIYSPPTPLTPGFYWLETFNGGTFLFAVGPLSEGERLHCFDYRGMGLDDSGFKPCSESPGGPVSANVQPAATPEPPSVAAASCGGYDGCVSSGIAALRADNWSGASADFQAASTLDPSKPDPWAGMGFADLPLGRGADLPGLWDKALSLGGDMEFGVWHELTFRNEGGTFTLSPTKVSFVNAKGRVLFAVAPAQVAVLGAGTVQNHALFRLRVANKNYNFDFVPFGVRCQVLALVQCPEIGVQQQSIVARYVAQAIPKLASGALTPAAAPPPASQPTSSTPSAPMPTSERIPLRAGQGTSSQASNAGEQQMGQVSGGIPASEIPPGDTLAIGTSKGSVKVNNFYKTALGIVEGSEVVMAQTAAYEIDYSAVDSSFIITIKEEPVSAVRSSAETALLNILGIRQKDACSLAVAVIVPAPVDAQLGGRSYPLSFCPSPLHSPSAGSPASSASPVPASARSQSAAGGATLPGAAQPSQLSAGQPVARFKENQSASGVGGNIRANEASAVGSLRTINAALVTYAASYGSGYARALAQLGGGGSRYSQAKLFTMGEARTADHARIIDTQLASGVTGGYRFTYSPGPPDAAGWTRTYIVVARPLIYGTTGVESFFTNWSSVIRGTGDNRDATVNDPPLAPSAPASAPSQSEAGCGGATDLGYSIQDGQHTYRVKSVTSPQGSRIHIFVDQNGSPVVYPVLLNKLALGAWTKELIVDRYNPGIGSGQVKMFLSVSSNLQGWEDATDVLARATVESIKAVVTGGTSLDTAPQNLTLGVVQRQLTNAKVALAHWAHAGLLQSLTDYTQMEHILPPTGTSEFKLSDLETIESLSTQANTLASVSETLAAAIAPTTWQEEFSNYLASAVNELKSSLPTSTTLLTLNDVLKLEELVAATGQSFSAYKQSLDLAQKVAASDQQKITAWATEAGTACRGTAAAGASANGSEESRFIIHTKQGDVAVLDFRKHAAYVTGDQQEVVLAENDNYTIVYNRDDSGFIIGLLSGSLPETRAAAEAAFLSQLGVSENDACRLTVDERVLDKSSPYNGELIGLSFCPGSMQIK